MRFTAAAEKAESIGASGVDSPGSTRSSAESPKSGIGSRRPYGPRKKAAANGPKVVLPEELVRLVASLPLTLVGGVCRRYWDLPVMFHDEQLGMCATALDTYLKSIEVVLTPAMALALAYGTAVSAAVGEAIADRASAAAATPVNDPGSPIPASPPV